MNIHKGNLTANMNGQVNEPAQLAEQPISKCHCRGPAAFTNFPANHYASVSTRNEPVKGRAGLGVKDRRFMGVAWCPPSQQFEARIWTRSVTVTQFGICQCYQSPGDLRDLGRGNSGGQ